MRVLLFKTEVVIIAPQRINYILNKQGCFGGKMGCLKGESEVKKKAAKFKCGKCGAAVNKKSHACKPVKVEESKKKAGKEKPGKKAKS